ncbi:DNA repair helicase XPB [Corynebacterium choanae]|uniref:DNA repair helicase XPB n=1 Tax=Corynebacterium choanae TaxID=1862358 RepID=UPI001FE5C304|nr:DNA repair helicase XPB [Corynebacterium choanae]
MDPHLAPLIVQPDLTVLLDINAPAAEAARIALSPFAELERAPEYFHTYRITPLALWNARAAGHDAEQLVDCLDRYSRFALEADLLRRLVAIMDRYGHLQLEQHPAHGLILTSRDADVLAQVTADPTITPMLGTRIDEVTCRVHPSERGRLKQALIAIEWPVEDLAGYVDGEAHPMALDTTTNSWQLRDYQVQACKHFVDGGSGVVVLPCGAGKTMVGAATMAELQATTLILVTTTVAGRQWRAELLRRTTLTEDEIGEYSGDKKEIRPVTIATYQVITRRTRGEFRALDLFSARDWGLIIYDEVHLLPAPIFRLTTDLQSRRRLGLTATLIREDGLESDVFSLIGPKRYEAPWKAIEAQGYIATADCCEVRVSFFDDEQDIYLNADLRDRYRIAAGAAEKTRALRKLLALHANEPTLIIGAYVDQLEELAAELDCPLVDGRTTNKRREQLFAEFRAGTITTLCVSKVANFSIDLPEASVAIQVSGTFGSRQEEAQRLGRILRPKSGNNNTAKFYTIVTEDTVDAQFAANRQRFLAEQGYSYRYVDIDEL